MEKSQAPARTAKLVPSVVTTKVSRTLFLYRPPLVRQIVGSTQQWGKPS